jgi:hypothetical protein
MKLLFQLRTFLGDQKPADFLTNFPARPFYIERARDELAPHFYLKLPILPAQFLRVLTEINKAFGLCYKLGFFFLFEYLSPTFYSFGNLYMRTTRPCNSLLYFLQKSITSLKKGYKTEIKKCRLSQARRYCPSRSGSPSQRQREILERTHTKMGFSVSRRN